MMLWEGDYLPCKLQGTILGHSPSPLYKTQSRLVMSSYQCRMLIELQEGYKSGTARTENGATGCSNAVVTSTVNVFLLNIITKVCKSWLCLLPSVTVLVFPHFSAFLVCSGLTGGMDGSTPGYINELFCIHEASVPLDVATSQCKGLAVQLWMNTKQALAPFPLIN